MTIADRIIHILLGVAVTIFAVGWWGEYRVRQAERTSYEQWEARAAQHILVTDEALRLALTNSAERGLAYTQAFVNVMARAKRDPSVVDIAPAPKKVEKR